MEVFVVRLNQGVRNFVYYYIVVQAGSGFDINTSAALYLTVAGRWQIFVEVAAEVITEITAEIAAEVAAEVIAEATNRLGYRLQI